MARSASKHQQSSLPLSVRSGYSHRRPAPRPGLRLHSDELEYVFGTLDTRPGYKWRPEDYKLSEQMQVYWTNFAKTGNPNGKDLPLWPNYNAKDGWQVLHLDAVTAARRDDHRDRYLFFQKYWNK